MVLVPHVAMNAVTISTVTSRPPIPEVLVTDGATRTETASLVCILVLEMFRVAAGVQGPDVREHPLILDMGI